MQEAFFGLEKAAMSYDYGSDMSFMSYARWHIKTAVRRNLGFLRTEPPCVSIYAPVGEDGEVELLDRLYDPLAEPVDAPAELADTQRTIHEAVDLLEPRLGEIVQRHYFKGETLTSIAESRGMSIARTASMHKTALQRLRRMKPIRGLYIEKARGSLHKYPVENAAIQRAEFARMEKLMAEYHAYHAGV